MSPYSRWQSLKLKLDEEKDLDFRKEKRGGGGGGGGGSTPLRHYLMVKWRGLDSTEQNKKQNECKGQGVARTCGRCYASADGIRPNPTQQPPNENLSILQPPLCYRRFSFPVCIPYTYYNIMHACVWTVSFFFLWPASFKTSRPGKLSVATRAPLLLHTYMSLYYKLPSRKGESGEKKST